MHTAQGRGHDVQGAFGECVAVSPSLWDLHARAPGLLKLKEHTWGWGWSEVGKETQLEVVYASEPTSCRKSCQGARLSGGLAICQSVAVLRAAGVMVP